MILPLPSRKLSVPLLLAGLLSAFILAGCAVLTVDVDVYKGSLANHPDVQLQQATAMAVAAEPLLIQLRDESESLFNLQMTDRPLVSTPSLVALEHEVQTWRFTHPDASTGYYAGYLNCDRARRINDILSLFHDSADSKITVIGLQLRSTAVALSNDWQAYLLATNRMQAVLTQEVASAAIESKVRSPNSLITNAQSRTNVNERALRSFIDLNEIFKKSKGKDSRVNAFMTDVEDQRKNLFNELADEGLGNVTNLIAETSKIVTNTPSAVLADLNKVLDQVLDLIAAINSEEFRRNCQYGELKETAANLATRLIGTTNLHTLFADCGEFLTGQNATVNEAIKTSPELFIWLQHKLQITRGRGMAGESALTEVLSNAVFSLTSEMGSLADMTGSTFSRGRLPLGLHTLTERFLTASFNNSTAETIKHEQDRLLDELVRFAEKVLFLANNNELLEPEEHTAGLIKGLRNIAKNGFYQWKSATDKRRSYKYILQAIGNSILVQIDELRERSSHDRDALAHARPELKSIKSAFDADPKTFFLNTLASIDAKVAALKKTADDIKETTNKIELAKKNLNTAKTNLETSFTNASAAQLTAAANFLNSEPPLITNLFTSHYADPTALSGKLKEQLNAILATNTTNADSLFGTYYLLTNTPPLKLTLPAPGHDEALAAFTNILPSLSNALSSSSNALTISLSALQLGADSGSAFTLVASNLTALSTNLLSSVTNISAADLPAARQTLADTATALRKLIPPTNVSYLTLSNSLPLLRVIPTNVSGALTTFSNMAALLKSDSDLTNTLPGCLSNSLPSLTNGFQIVTTNLLRWTNEFATAVKKLQDLITALQKPQSTNEFIQATNNLNAGMTELRGSFEHLQGSQDSFTGAYPVITSSFSCLTSSVPPVAEFYRGAIATNQTMRFWFALRDHFIGRIAGFKNLKKTVDDAQSALSDLQSKLAELEEQNARRTQLVNAGTTLRNWQTNFAEDPFGQNAVKQLIEKLRVEKDKKSTNIVGGLTASSTIASDALAVLDEFNLPIDMSSLEFPNEIDGTHPRAKDALDALISRLRYEHLRVIQETGENSPRAVSLAAAIRVAHEQRTGMIFIRPASSYLRTSYPATSLQSDASIGWKNMLSQHMGRQTPVLGSWLEDRNNLSTILEVDKQFWQNINRVRVAGGGRGNYVIAKDDLGNWYVKQYASDPQDVIKSAKNLAMFSLGPALGANLPINNTVPGSILNTNVTASKGKTLLEFQLDTFQSNYVAQTREVYTNLSQTFTRNALKDKINSAWGSASTNQDAVAKLTKLAETGIKPLVELPSIPTEAPEMEKRLNESLASIIQVHYAIQNAVRTSDLDPATKDQALKSARQVLLAEIKTPLQRRRDALGSFKSGVTVLNSSLSQ